MRKTVWLAALRNDPFHGGHCESERRGSRRHELEDRRGAGLDGQGQGREAVQGDARRSRDGNITLSAPKVGSEASPYSVSKAGEKDFTFKAERSSSGEGSSVWTGTIHEKEVKGQMILTKNDGAVSHLQLPR